MSSHPLSDTEIAREFSRAVNMTPDELEAWLKTDESRDVGWTHDGESESVGHQSGRRIVDILRKRHRERSEDDVAHMRKVIGYIRRHLAQCPDVDVEHTRWRYSLMNWGHDPLKDLRGARV